MRLETVLKSLYGIDPEGKAASAALMARSSSARACACLAGSFASSKSCRAFS